MRNLLFLSLALLLLSGCGARTKYTVVVDMANYLSSKSGNIPTAATDSTIIVPNNDKAGLLVPLPKQDVIEDARLNVKVTLQNTGASNMSGKLEVRMAPSSDSSDITDGAGGDFALTNIDVLVTPGSSQVVPLDLVINATANPNAFSLIKNGQFRMAFKLTVSSPGGTFSLNQARISVTGRPFALIQ